MAPIGKLYTYPKNVRAYKALIAAQYAKVEVEVPADFKFGETNKQGAFLAKFPFGKVPAFETSDGKPIFEADAIAYYVAAQNPSANLLGKNAYEQALVQQFICLADQEIYPAACTWVFPILGVMPFQKGAVDKAKSDLDRALTALNVLLKNCTFLVGERVSLADIVVAVTLLPLFENCLGTAMQKKFGNVTRWFNTCIHQAEFKKVLGEVTLCTEEKQAACGTAAAGACKEKKEVKKEAAPAPKKEESKKEKATEEDADMMEVEEKEEKPEKFFETLPKSTFDFDEFKRKYSNEDTEAVALPYLWANFDKEGYSIWRGDYKYNNELSKIFMTCNLVAGFFQRVDKLRRFAFGSMCVFGEDNKNAISGVWIVRGKKLAFEMNDDWNVDAPSYEWKQLNPDSPADRQVVNEFFAWSGKEFSERHFNQGKIFK